MKKQELLKLHRLEANPAMVRMAQADTPRKTCVARSYYTWTCKYELFLRAKVEKGILKIAMYLPNVLRSGGRRPAYTIFVDRKERKFITFDYELQRWSNSKLDRLEWREKHYYNTTQWISRKEEATIKNYLGTTGGGYLDILKYQLDIRNDELCAKHRRETDLWDADLQQTPALPKNWNKWVAKVGIPEHFIFYQYTRKGATSGYCSYCEKEVPIRFPQHNKEGRCPCCRHKITFKSIGKAGRVFTDTHSIYLIQQCSDGMMIRLFQAYHCYPKGDHTHPIQHISEVNRSIYTATGKFLNTYHWGNYKNCEIRWVEGHICHVGGYYFRPAYHIDFDGTVYGYTLPGLIRKGLGRTGFMEYWASKGHQKIDPEWYLEKLEQIPQLELLVKAGLPHIVGDVMRNTSWARSSFDTEATALTKAMRIDSQELKRLRANHGGIAFLEWLQFEKATGKAIPDEDIHWLCKEDIKLSQIKFAAIQMTIQQICHYIRRNMMREHMNSREVITTWADYLSMAKAFHYDLCDESVYRPGKLRQRHDELAMRSKEKDIAIQAGEVLQKFPHVDEIYQELQEKYTYVGQEYMIIVPENVIAIIKEGRTLHHCIANSDRYWDRIETHESYLLFLRKKDDPKQAYYTLEIEPNGTVRQIRTYHDTQNEDDIEKARDFLREWQSVISKRLTEADRIKAEKSKTLREQEFVQLRKNHITIHTGNLSGHLLVDVLTADLMETQAA